MEVLSGSQWFLVAVSASLQFPSFFAQSRIFSEGIIGGLVSRQQIGVALILEWIGNKERRAVGGLQG